MSIYKIAQITGYSPSVVARALSNSGYCNAEKRKRVLEVAQQINYQPNQAARSLRSNKTRQILFCIPDICNPFYFEMIDGVLHVLEQHGYYAMLYPSKKSLDREIQMIDRFKSHFYDGIIFVSFDFCEKNISALRRAKVPAVLTNHYSAQRDDDNFDYVFSDHTLGMQLATEHLLQKGCRNILLLSGDITKQTSRERYDGFLRAMQAGGITPNPEYLLNGEYSAEASYRAFAQFMERGKPIDGIIAANDLSAVGILRYCREHGIRIPQQVRIVSFDNTDYAKTSLPSLTSVDLKQHDIGVAAAELLLQRLEDGRTTPCNRFLQPTLIVRDST